MCVWVRLKTLLLFLTSPLRRTCTSTQDAIENQLLQLVDGKLSPCLRNVLNSLASFDMTAQNVFMLAGRCVDAWLSTFILFSRAVSPMNRPTVDDAEAMWRGVTLLAREMSELSSTTVEPDELLPRSFIDAFVQVCVLVPELSNVDGASHVCIADPGALAAKAKQRANAVRSAKHNTMNFTRVVNKLIELHKSMLSDSRRDPQLCFQVRYWVGGSGWW